MAKLTLVVLISGNGSNLQAIIDQINNQYLDAEIKCVISNKPNAYGLKRAEIHAIPCACLDHTEFSSREAYDAELIKLISPIQPDIIILAGFMRILSDSFFTAFTHKVLNIHPSLLPKYQGLQTHQKALDNNDQSHGISVHIATPKLDSGPVIAQADFAITKHDNIEALQQRCHTLEHTLYPLVIKWLINGQLNISSGQVIFNGKALSKPIMLNQVNQHELPTTS